MERAPEQGPQPPWIAMVQDALARYKELSGKERRRKLPLTHRDVERELSWHNQGRADGKLNDEQYWKAVAQTLHDYGVYDFIAGGSMLEE